MSKNHVEQCLIKYAKSNSVRLHMPGHKGQGSGYFANAFECDITELSFSDNLANASGVIQKAQNDIAQICGAKYSRILTGGSTLGVLAALYAVKDKGKKIIVERFAHKSVFNALKLFNIEPVFLNASYSGGFCSLDYSAEKAFDSCDNELIGALLTSPDYFGRAVDLKDISKRLKANNKILIVDGAHGAHFVFNNPLQYAGKYADIWVDGAHKSLQTLTQGAILHLNDLTFKNGIEEGLSIFSTSSPSYLIMASVESGVKNFLAFKNKRLKSFEKAKNYLIEQIIKCGYSILPCQDDLKLTLLLNGKVNGYALAKALEKNGIYPELVSDNCLLFMFSYAFSLKQAQKTAKVICEFKGKKTPVKEIDNHKVKTKLSYLSAVNAPCEWIELKNACGRICAENAGLFPPCYPVILAGEVFDNGVIQALSVKNTFGINNGTVKVVKEQ